ncbi:MAG: divalent-cation tolerance protein CutA [Alphaproteobacteria bacterium]
MAQFQLIYITCRDVQEARLIAHALVQEKLAACANIMPHMHSIYCWDGAVQESAEVLLLFKSDENFFATIAARVKELHSYSTPCVVAVPLVAVESDYAAWLQANILQ